MPKETGKFSSEEVESHTESAQSQDNVGLIEAWLANLLYKGYVDSDYLSYLKKLSQKPEAEFSGRLTPQDYQLFLSKIETALKEGRLKLWEDIPETERQKIKSE